MLKKKRQMCLLFLIYIFPIFIIFSNEEVIQSSIKCERTNIRLFEENSNYSELVYTDIKFLLNLNDVILIEDKIYNNYLDGLTEDNMEDWWQGYKLYALLTQTPHITDIYSEDELSYLYRCVETEAHQQPFSAKVNVANVILNRVEDENFGDSPKEVVTAPKQFCYGRTHIDDSTIEACAFAYAIEDTTQGAVYFHSMGYRSKFNGADYVFTDSAGHHFYRR